jgi:peptidyl-prolyl cis-trans isomerase SurA
MKKVFVIAIVFIAFLAQAQETVFTVGDKAISTAEFERVYKKNIDLVQDENQKKIDTYLDLYVKYQLKLQEAYSLGLNEDKKYQNELKQYSKDLMKSYLIDADATDKLIKEAYNRGLKEVRASHILVRVPEDALPKDTLAAYNEILKVRNKVLNGIAFEKAAKQFSQDPSAKQNAGDLGYFTVFSMVYPFETAVYNTPKGKISDIFRTRFGYHIAKVTDVRDAHGEVETAHIMIASNQKNIKEAKQKIDNIYKQLQSGVDFFTLAKRLSDDKKSAVKGGRLPIFGINKMVPSFEKAAFAIEKVGNISAPFQSPYGWHIIKLIRKIPIKSYEASKQVLKRKIENDVRSKIITTAFLEKIKKNYKITSNKKVAFKTFEKALNTSFFKGQWIPTKEIMANKTVLLTINDTQKTVRDFAIHLRNHQIKLRGNVAPSITAVLQKQYKDFENLEVLNYYKSHLEETNPEFAHTMQEYRDGVLLFNLMNAEVWEKASKDTLGLQTYYENNKAKYRWEKRAEVLLATVTDKTKAKQVRKMLKAGKSKTVIETVINTDGKLYVLFSLKKIEDGTAFLPKKYRFKAGVSRVLKDKDNFIVIKTSKLQEPKQKTFKECKGQVINDYQNQLERKWLESLAKKYKVVINKEVIVSLKQQYN